MENTTRHSKSRITREFNTYEKWAKQLYITLPNTTIDKPKFLQLYLMPKSWIIEWKKSIHYDEIKTYMHKNKLNRVESDDMEQIIPRLYEGIFLKPINNEALIRNIKIKYPNEGLEIMRDYFDPLHDLFFANKECWDLFSRGIELEKNTINV